MANASPEEISVMRGRMDAQVSYELSGPQLLKKQGNELHSQGRFEDALQKYSLANKNLSGIPAVKGRSLLLACSLNITSCYLKSGQYDECIKKGTEVLVYEEKNVKALYCRGQAYKELGQLEGCQRKIVKEGAHRASRGLVIEEITEEEAELSSGSKESRVSQYAVSQRQRVISPPKSQFEIPSVPSSSESLDALKADPESIRSFQNFLSH